MLFGVLIVNQDKAFDRMIIFPPCAVGGLSPLLELVDLLYIFPAVVTRALNPFRVVVFQPEGFRSIAFPVPCFIIHALKHFRYTDFPCHVSKLPNLFLEFWTGFHLKFLRIKNPEIEHHMKSKSQIGGFKREALSDPH